MSIDQALQSDIFLTYVAIVAALLVFAGLVLGGLRLSGKDVSAPARTYRGWLVMIPLVFGTLFLGREATIIGVALLAVVSESPSRVPLRPQHTTRPERRTAHV